MSKKNNLFNKKRQKVWQARSWGGEEVYLETLTPKGKICDNFFNYLNYFVFNSFDLPELFNPTKLINPDYRTFRTLCSFRRKHN